MIIDTPWMPNVLGGGDVAGPASATDNAVARFDGTTGKLIQNSTVTIADTTGAIAGASSLTAPAAIDLTLAGGTAGSDSVVVSNTLAASSSIIGAFKVGNGTAATNVAIGGGNINAGGTGTFGGRIGINGAAANFAGVNVSGIMPNIGGDSNGVGYFSNGTFPASFTAGAHSFYSLPATTASAYTVTNVTGFYAAAPTKGAGSTITNAYGVYVEALTQGTNNYAFRSVGGGIVSIADSTAGSASAGALVVTGGLSAGAASYFGGKVSSNDRFYAASSGGGFWAGAADLTLGFYDAAGAMVFRTSGINQLTLAATTGAATFAGAVTVSGTLNANSAGSNVSLAANGTTVQSGIIVQANTGFVFFSDYATVTKGIKVDVNNGGLTILSGALTTATPTGGTAKPWKVGEAATVSPTSPNRTIRVEIDGTVYFLAAKTTND